jgi:HAD superfamily hydrolase (TIGR01549 family)
VKAVTFDYGQTLAELDLEFLAARLAERRFVFDLERGGLGMANAWHRYSQAKLQGLVGKEAWCAFMRALLAGGSPAAPDEIAAQADWLWSEQPARNLWRKPIAGMFELVRELRAAQIPVGIVSNSEGRLTELIDEVGLTSAFHCIADSGCLGVEKPDQRIFSWAASRLGVSPRDLVHIGDLWHADVEGALGVGALAIWFSAERVAQPSERVVVCRDAVSVRSALQSWGLMAPGVERNVSG